MGNCCCDKAGKKFVYSFGGGKAEGDETMRMTLGGKGAGLAEMVKIGLPVPAGFTISIDACELYYNENKTINKCLEDEIKQHLAELEQLTGKKLGDANDPLLVSVRSGAARSMPGMMETILNLGLNDLSVEGLAKKTDNPRFAYDSYRRFIQMYATTAMGLSKEPMEEMLTEMKKKLGVKTDPEIPAENLKELCKQFKAFYKEKMGGVDFPQDPLEQLWGAIKAVFGSWFADKAVTYRRVEKITDLKGTAVNIVQMVFGNKGDNSSTGVCFTRDPNTGENTFYGDYLVNAQGEDVVAGIRDPEKLIALEAHMPECYKELCDVRAKLEDHYKDMQDIEFTIEDRKLYILQCRSGKRTPEARFRIAYEMVQEGLITKEAALMMISQEDIERLFFPVIAEKDPAKLKPFYLATGVDAVPGAATGQVYFTAESAEKAEKDGKDVILVRKETSPEDIGGMHAAKGILTSTGGKTSHAAVVARGWGKCCIVGCTKLEINEETNSAQIAGKPLKEGDWITLNGSTGEVFTSKMELKQPIMPESYNILMGWADEIRTINVRTNADTPEDSAIAISHGAEGIGLCRTEHMFFATRERQLAIQQMIVADTVDTRKLALAKLLPFQKDDFVGIFKAMSGKPVTIRLIDPPLHEFTPKTDEAKEELSKYAKIPVADIERRINALHELNPMLGFRGCRLAVVYPEILEMQVSAIILAAIECAKAGVDVQPEIMIPLTIEKRELSLLVDKARTLADKLIAEANISLKYMIGTMIEIPRAALTADKIAEVAEFFSFGTNDLTQCTMGLSRDDAGTFLPDYVEKEKLLDFDPFQVLDQEGVGQLVKIGIERGRSTRPNLKIGICGEHGGEARSVKFCCRAGMNYVSCSPLRVPVARMAAAQAVIEDKKCKK